VFERFTERARQVVVLAQDEARSLRHNFIGTEHLLLGLLREEEGIAARVLDELGVTLAAVRAEVGKVGGGDEATTGQIPFTPSAKKTLECALREAVGMRHDYIGTEHILLGLTHVDECVALKVLAGLGVEPDHVRDRVIGMLSGRAGTRRDHDYAVDTFADVEGLAQAAGEWRREGWEISSITVQRRRKRQSS
jgi:ATP-dependent Clp protease ATP-binding subunit ClpC